MQSVEEAARELGLGAHGPRPLAGVAVIAVDRRTAAAARVTELLESVFAPAEPRALLAAIRDARARTRGDGQVAALLPSTRPDLVALAAIDGVERIAVLHDRADDPPELLACALRASLALVDLTVATDDASEKSAVRAGADPDRLVRDDEELVERLLQEPHRKPRRSAALEAVASLALDAAMELGLLRVLELATPDRGVNVVNYHRVLPRREITAYCRPQMAIAEPVFEAQLELISRLRGFTRVDRIHEDHSAGKVAITFDDGYEDNFRVALPVLQRFSTPACIFVVTNLIGRPDALWWDRVGLALFVYWRDGCVADPPSVLPARTYALRSTRSFAEARGVISGVISELNLAGEDERIAAVRGAESLVPKLAPCRTMLSWEEVEAMARLGVTFGAHTRNHIPLDEVPPEVARDELFGSRTDLDRRLPLEQPALVALPRGRLGALSEHELRAQEIDGVMTSKAGVNPVAGDSIFVLRRDGRMLTLQGRHHPAKLRLELTGIVDRVRALIASRAGAADPYDAHAGRG